MTAVRARAACRTRARTLKELKAAGRRTFSLRPTPSAIVSLRGSNANQPRATQRVHAVVASSTARHQTMDQEHWFAPSAQSVLPPDAHQTSLNMRFRRCQALM